MVTNDELVHFIFDGKQSALRDEFAGWVQSSRRFKAFVITYSTKIRTKIRNVRDERGIRDVRAELETALLLLRAERFTLAYETYAASKQRGPDFTVTFKTHTPFNVEVRRIRSGELQAGDTQARIGKLMTVLCDKVGQMPPSIVNLLWLTAGSEIAGSDISGAALQLRQLAERQADDLFVRYGLKSASDFIKQFQRLSGIVLHTPETNVLWLNALARHPLPPEIASTVRRLDQSTP